MKSHPSDVTAVILTRGRTRLFTAALTSVLKQHYLPKEILVINDNTGYTPLTLPHASIPIRVLKNTRHSIPFGRMLGAKAATTPFIVYIDDDLTVKPSYISRLRAHFTRDNRLTAVMGRIQNVYTDNPYSASQCAYYERGLLEAFTSLTAVAHLPIGRMLDAECMMIRRNTLVKTGMPVRPGIYKNDDVELGIRLQKAGKRMLFDGNIIANAHPRLTFTSWIHAAFWNGYSDMFTERFYGQSLRISPYPSRYLSWYIKKVHHNPMHGPGRIYYPALLLLYPFITRIGKYWQRIQAI